MFSEVNVGRIRIR